MLELGKVDASSLPTGGLRLARVATDWSSFEEDMMEVVGLWQHERKRKHPTLCFRKLAGERPAPELWHYRLFSSGTPGDSRGDSQLYLVGLDA